MAIVILLFYSVAAIGGKISLNYCEDELTDISFSSLTDFRCCCTDEIDADCCDESTITIKKTDVHQTFELNFDGHSSSIADLPFFYLPDNILLCAIEQGHIKSPLPKPPLLTQNFSLYILHSVFRI